MQATTNRQLLKPDFLDSKIVQIAVATSDYCNARCESCIWPYMESSGKVMSLKDFEILLDRFEGFRFSEFAFNVINEPFVDRGICQKINKLAQRQLSIKKLFFSSNWLLPKPDRLSEFVASIEACMKCPTISSISINATISGIDRESYDRQQAGLLLTDTVNKYRTLDFQKAVRNICEVLAQLSSINISKPVVFCIKAYGDLFTQDSMHKFWDETLLNYGISSKFLDRHVKIILNHEYITFARSLNATSTTPEVGRRKCKSRFLTEKLTIGSGGEVGLCCQDGIRSIVIGNILNQNLVDLVFSNEYQKHLRIVTGMENPESNHPCDRCEFHVAMSS